MKSSEKQKAAVIAFVVLCLIMGLVIGRQALETRVSPEPLAEAEQPTEKPQEAKLGEGGPRVSRGVEPRGWVDLDRSDLEDLLSLPGMTRPRAAAVIRLREKNPDLKPEDLLTLPGISQKDLDVWKPYLWERDEDSAAAPGRP